MLYYPAWRCQQIVYHVSGYLFRILIGQIYLSNNVLKQHSTIYIPYALGIIVNKKHAVIRYWLKNYYENGSLFEAIEYIYGNVIKEEYKSGYAEYTETYTNIYFYDKMGNWLTKEWYSEGELLEKIERVITYY